jgi:dihydrodipicolinate synthase/N-acetylneuraminate lyase
VGLRGIVPSLNTPFDTRGGLDLSSLGALADHCVGTGCAGLLCLAVAAESDALSQKEWQAAARAIVEGAAGRLPVILSVSHGAQKVRLERARFAAAIGAHGILCQPPAGSATDRAALLKEVGAAGPDFLMVQDLDWAGPGLAIDEIVALFEAIPQFASLKIEVAPAGPKYTKVLAATGGRLHVCGGWAVLQMIEALGRGVHGFMPTCMEALYVQIYSRFESGDVAGARALHADLLPVLAFSNQHIFTSIGFFKRLRVAEGLFSTPICRPPVPPLDPHQELEAKLLMDQVARLTGVRKIKN